MALTIRGRGQPGCEADMTEGICATEGCQRARLARGLCQRCYGRGYRTGTLPEWQPERPYHRLTQVDRDAATAVCVVCGPTRLYLQSGQRGYQCITVRCATKARWRANHPDRVANTPQGRRASRFKRYGIDEARFDQILEAQNGCCPICRRVPDVAVIDHDHSCCSGSKTSCGACVRGILCAACNAGLGFFRDDKESLTRALMYLSA
jgi:hypothetical protein